MRNIWNHICRNAWIVIPLLASSIQSFLFLSATMSSLSAVTKIVMAMADTLVVYILFAFTPGRFNKFTIWLPGFALSVFCIANSVYYKAFSDLISIETLRLAPAVDTIIMRSAISLFSATEILILAIYLIELTLLYLFPRVKWTVLSKRGKTMDVTSMIFALLLSTMLSIRRAGIYAHSESLNESLISYKESWNLQTTNLAYYSMFGLHGFIIHAAINLENEEPLSSQELSEIKSFIQNNDSRNKTALIEIFHARNNKKNLIFIVVESLASDVLENPRLRKNLPILDSLLNDPSTISALRIMPQTGLGRSSDGQFIYNTGLLPLKKTALVESHALADYPSLAKALHGHNSVEIIGESKNMWRHFLTSESYGFDALYDMVAPDNYNADEKIFGKVLSIIDTLPQPFFILATTLSMHHPYDKPSVDIKKNLHPASNLTDERDINYLIDTAAFDYWLGMLIEKLKRQGIYDDCIIVIASDHEPGSSTLSDAIDNSHIAFLIVNAGLGMKIEQEIRQIDLFPTILDVMGVEEYIIPSLRVPYRGLGSSVFAYSNHADEEECESYSNLPDSTLTHYSERLIMSRIFEN